MALPVDLTAGWVSILLKVSPNNIAPENTEIEKTGIISSVIPTVRPELVAGQYVLFMVNEKQVKVIYSNDTYFLVQEKDIIYIEHPTI